MNEAEWAEKLAAAEERLAASQREADRLRHHEEIESDYVCPDSLRADAAEELARRYEEALRNAVEMIHDASGPLEYARANDWMRGQLLALNPPPEAEKKGEG